MREENESARRGREAYNFVRQLNTKETMAAVNLKWQNQQKKRSSYIYKNGLWLDFTRLKVLNLKPFKKKVVKIVVY